MKTNVLVVVHLYLAAFFTPMVLFMAASGGLYLFGFKGTTERSTIALIENQQLNMKHDDLYGYVDTLLQQVGVKADFEYIKAYSDALLTRPSSREHYRLQQTHQGIEISLMKPDLNAQMMELHKGHGPAVFKYFERAFAIGLIVIMLSGLYMGLKSTSLRYQTLALVTGGFVVFIIAAFA